ILEARINETIDGRNIEYIGNWGESKCYLELKNIFLTKEEAEIRCQERIKIQQEEEKKKLAWSKEKAHNSYSWHVGYHGREIKRLEKQLEHHRARYINCKLRAKEDKNNEKPNLQTSPSI
ncbi:MAG: hypothetical protein AABY22_11250, partial [Nanoarchaeota archaeon]